MIDSNALLHSAPAALALLDASGLIVRTNEPWNALVGVNSNSCGKAWFEVLNGLDREACLIAWREILDSRCARAFEAYAANREQSDHLLEITINPTADGGAVRAIACITDMTPLRFEEARAQAVMDTAVDAIITIDAEGTIQTVNASAARLFRYERTDMIGRSINDLMPEPHRTDHDRYIQNYLRTGRARIIGIGRELQALRKDGTRIPIHLAVSEFSIGGDRRFAGIVRDITDQQLAREQHERLAHAGRLSIMGEMTAGIAHEINQPLTAITMYAQSAMRMLDRGNADTDKLRSALEKLSTQTLRAGAVIERIQRFIRDQDGLKEAIDINDLIVDLMGLARTDSRLHDIDIKLDLAPSIPPIWCDPVQIQQVGLNLLRNAIDAMTGIDCANGRQVSVSTERLDGRVRVAVQDAGPGIDAANEKHLFKPFHTTKADGMGMGLSISRSIINSQGGELAYARNDDFGVTFYFTLPLMELPEATTSGELDG